MTVQAPANQGGGQPAAAASASASASAGQGGVAIATGSGAAASGGGNAANENTQNNPQQTFDDKLETAKADGNISSEEAEDLSQAADEIENKDARDAAKMKLAKELIDQLGQDDKAGDEKDGGKSGEQGGSGKADESGGGGKGGGKSGGSEEDELVKLLAKLLGISEDQAKELVDKLKESGGGEGGEGGGGGSDMAA